MNSNNLPPILKSVLGAIASCPGSSIRELANILGVSVNHCFAAVKRLIKANLIYFVQGGPDNVIVFYVNFDPNSPNVSVDSSEPESKPAYTNSRDWQLEDIKKMLNLRYASTVSLVQLADNIAWVVFHEPTPVMLEWDLSSRWIARNSTERSLIGLIQSISDVARINYFSQGNKTVCQEK